MDSITVGWDSEYTTVAGPSELGLQGFFYPPPDPDQAADITDVSVETPKLDTPSTEGFQLDLPEGFCPISDQLHVLEDGREYFLPHVGRRTTFRSVIDRLLTDYPDVKAITMVAHFGRVEMMGAADGTDWLMPTDTGDITGSSLILQKTIIGKWQYQSKYRDEPVQVDLWDSMLLHPGSLESLGNLINMPKLESHGYREGGRMLDWYLENPTEFRSYAIRDAEVAVKFYEAYHAKVAEAGLISGKTIGSVFERAAAEAIEDGDFSNLLYQRKKVWNGKYSVKRLVPTKAANAFTPSYYGGRNETYLFGRFDQPVHDYDLIGAYSNTIGMLPTWETKGQVFTDPELLYKFVVQDPLALGRIHISFSFHQDVKYPGLPVASENGVIFPRSGETDVMLQEFMASYPHLESCEIIAWIYPSSGDSPIVNLSQELKERRNKSKACGDHLGDAIWKLVLNAGYGKFAQGVRTKQSVDLENSTTDNIVRSPIPPSRTTNPAIAAFITGWCRALIAEYLYFCQDKGYEIGNVTTDGFTVLGDPLPDDTMNGVGPLGRLIRDKYENQILELKHQGKGFLSLKTRGYTMIESDNYLVAATGISMRGKTGQEKARFLINEFNQVTALADTRYPVSRPPTVIDWITKKCSPIFVEAQQSYNYDYDLKRMPVNIEDNNGKAKFQTKAWESIVEYTTWRDHYQDFRRGVRSEGRQIGTKNKILTTEDLNKFIDYAELRQAGFTSMAYATDRADLRIIANVAKRLTPLGFKKIASKLNVPAQTVRYWTLKEPMSDADLKKTAVEELLVSRVSNVNSKESICTSHLTPSTPTASFEAELLLLWQVWTGLEALQPMVTIPVNAGRRALRTSRGRSVPPKAVPGGLLELSGSHLTPWPQGSG